MSQMPIPFPANPSRWQYVTASGGGLTIAFVAGGGGSITGAASVGSPAWRWRRCC